MGAVSQGQRHSRADPSPLNLFSFRPRHATPPLAARTAPKFLHRCLWECNECVIPIPSYYLPDTFPPPPLYPCRTAHGRPRGTKTPGSKPRSRGCLGPVWADDCPRTPKHSLFPIPSLHYRATGQPWPPRLCPFGQSRHVATEATYCRHHPVPLASFRAMSLCCRLGTWPLADRSGLSSPFGDRAVVPTEGTF